MPSTKVVRITVMTGLLLAIAVVCVLGVTVSGRAAVTALAGLLALWAAARAWAPDTVVPGARSRAFDVTFLLALALVLAYLSPWGNAMVPAAA
ncbi:hypothetical protein [Georgenia sp. AZ-5]|uniref:hypothetical protein n=1 Tax=Georgenia sp. AZ-5 TaxID=3367526 RepID=UPI0037546BD7